MVHGQDWLRNVTHHTPSPCLVAWASICCLIPSSHEECTLNHTLFAADLPHCRSAP